VIATGHVILLPGAYYDPTRSRFVSEDPIGLAGGDLDLFAYVQNRPVSLGDPSGHVAALPLLAPLLGPAAEAALGATVGLLSGLILGGAISDAGTGPPAPEDPNSCPKDPCAEILKRINDLTQTINQEYAKSLTDPLDLYGKAYGTNPGGSLAGKGTWLGHIQRNRGLTHGLKNLVDQAAAKGCPISPRALEALSRGWPGGPLSR